MKSISSGRAFVRRSGVAVVIAQIAAAFALAGAFAGSLAAPAAANARKPLQIVALGDSLTAGFMLPAEAAFPSVLQRRLAAMGYSVEIANAGVSGDTTTGGLARLDWSTPEGTDLVIVELGANDMLRAVPPEMARRNLETILQKLKARKIPVVLAGMKSLGNWGEDYARKFEAIYPELALAYGAPLYPYFLAGVQGENKMTLPDELHPNAAGVERIVDWFAPFLAAVLTQRFGPPQKS